MSATSSASSAAATDPGDIWDGLIGVQKDIGTHYIKQLMAYDESFRHWSDGTAVADLMARHAADVEKATRAVSVLEYVGDKLNPAVKYSAVSVADFVTDITNTKTEADAKKALLDVLSTLRADGRKPVSTVISMMKLGELALSFTQGVHKDLELLPEPKPDPVPTDLGQLGVWYQKQMGGEDLKTVIVTYIELHKTRLVSKVDDLERYGRIVRQSLRQMYPGMNMATLLSKLRNVDAATFEKYIGNCRDRVPRILDVVRHLNQLNVTHGNPVCPLSALTLSVDTFNSAMGCLIHARMQKEHSMVKPFESGTGLVEMIDKAVQLIPVTGDTVPTTLREQGPFGGVSVPQGVGNIAPLAPGSRFPSSSGVNKRKRGMDISSAI